ncbi:unnamed protein product [Prorocentrum cordatum]|uniref:Profilin n=1 Tax=Prorocentrum cordatum TaxID=2364126 RepID=A0ABN9U4I7_9DINO|nr:unnamed protein product [Polarella glacialis]
MSRPSTFEAYGPHVQNSGRRWLRRRRVLLLQGAFEGSEALVQRPGAPHDCAAASEGASAFGSWRQGSDHYIQSELQGQGGVAKCSWDPDWVLTVKRGDAIIKVGEVVDTGVIQCDAEGCLQEFADTVSAIQNAFAGFRQ